MTTDPHDDDVEPRVKQFEDALQPAPDTHPGALGTFAGHVITQYIACGSFGLIYLAERVATPKRRVVLKAIPAASSDPVLLERFHRETGKAGIAFHDNVMPVLDLGEERGIPFFTMPFSPGRTLEDAAVKRDLDNVAIVRIGIAVANGLAFTHKTLGLIHRDVKPANIWLCVDGGVKLLDFGLALQREVKSNLTMGLIGTPDFCSPEHFTGDYDERSDLFSLGAVLYYLTTGRLPFDGADPVKKLNNVREHDPPAPHNLDASVPIVLSGVIMRLLNKNPSDRFQTAVEASKELSDAIPVSYPGRTHRPTSVPFAARVLQADQYRISGTAGLAIEQALTCLAGGQVRRIVDRLVHDLNTLLDETGLLPIMTSKGIRDALGDAKQRLQEGLKTVHHLPPEFQPEVDRIIAEFDVVDQALDSGIEKAHLALGAIRLTAKKVAVVLETATEQARLASLSICSSCNS